LDFLAVLGIAVALAMDAFAVAIGTGMVLGRPSGHQTFRLSFHFGLFQFLMPIVGWLAGQTVAEAIEGVDHWIAFGLLAAVGGHMIKEGLGPPEEARRDADPTRGLSLVVLSVATSIDALAVGLSMALLGVSIWYPSVVIGLVAAAFTLAGLRLGRLLGQRFGHGMALLGGVILVAIGLKILLEHLGVG
jgi:manganese efflux pump family protein